ncbi:GIY-YIG nuclease family protein [Noviherbaspirillum sp. ST9]|uniref:GIY-YIG nuclease family protein n=1 Tax=Noviherbaspirillum sp. ST9 TaxID=3401606 RepID=UPI003B58777F
MMTRERSQNEPSEVISAVAEAQADWLDRITSENLKWPYTHEEVSWILEGQARGTIQFLQKRWNRNAMLRSVALLILSELDDELSEEEELFLERMGIDSSEVFNAKGMKPRKAWQDAMYRVGAKVALNAGICSSGHRLKWHSGHCAQCRTENPAYSARHKASGEVYIAYSRRGRLVKVGFSQSSSRRITELCSGKHGGFDDWEIKHAVACPAAGNVECKAQRLLSKYRVPRLYIKDVGIVKTRETFSCSLAQARDALEKACNEEQ